MVESGQGLDEQVSAFVCELVPACSEHVESLLQVKVKVTMEVSSHKLMDLIFTLGVQVLELVEISLDVETVRCENVRLPLDEVLTLHPRDLTDRGEHVGQVGAGSLYTISVVDPSLP